MTIPGAPTALAVSYDEDRVKIDWSAPVFTGGNHIALTYYKIEVLTNTSDVYSEITCQESQATMIVLSTPTCSI
jgi:hypothetical protein